jgi:hypothetical protein
VGGRQHRLPLAGPGRQPAQGPTEFQQGVHLGPLAPRKRRELTIVAEILAATSDRQERLRRWREQTGKSEPTLYRRIAELEGAAPGE